MLTPEQWKMIESLKEEDPTRLRLSYHGKLEMSTVIDQIECRQRTAAKLATTLRNVPRFMFPSALSAEQATSDSLATYHTSLIDEGCRLLDMTCGLGIDDLHFAGKAAQVDAFDINPVTAAYCRHNVGLAGMTNLNVNCADSTNELMSLSPDSYDCIFIDPARRASSGKRLFALSDCSPNVVTLLPNMLRVAPKVIIKASPMLDVTHTAYELSENVEQIIALGDRRECKELVIICSRLRNERPLLQSITLVAGEPTAHFSFTKADEEKASAFYSTPDKGDYLYEPFPATIKIAPFKLLSEEFGINKIAPNSHLYFSKSPVTDFPGKRFRIIELAGFGKKGIKTLTAKFDRLDISVRNFMMKPEEIAGRLKIKAGGGQRLFATRSHDNKPLLLVVDRED